MNREGIGVVLRKLNMYYDSVRAGAQEKMLLTLIRVANGSTRDAMVESAMYTADEAVNRMGVYTTDSDLPLLEEFYTYKVGCQLEGILLAGLTNTVIRYLQEVLQILETRATPPHQGELVETIRGTSFHSVGESLEATLVNGMVVSRCMARCHLAGLIDTLPDEAVSRSVRKLRNRIQEPPILLGVDRMVDIAIGTKSLLQVFHEKVICRVKGRERYLNRKVWEVLGIFNMVQKKYRGGGILDLCTGTGDLATILQLWGCRESVGIDCNDTYLSKGRAYAGMLGIGDLYLAHGDVLSEDLPQKSMWVSKHPCAHGMALPDEIIRRFMEDKNANTLCLLTCCAFKSIGCKPSWYSNVTDQEWDTLCSQSSAIHPDSSEEDVANAMGSLRRINELRIQHVTSSTSNITAKLVEIQGTIQNQMIVLEKVKETTHHTRGTGINNGATFGVELEFQYPKSVDILGKMKESGRDTKKYEEESQWFFFDSWYTSREGSINVTDGHTPMELDSPILQGVEGILEVKEVCEILQGSMAEANDSCGLHVHVYHELLDPRGPAGKDRAIQNIQRLLDGYHSMGLSSKAGRAPNQYCKIHTDSMIHVMLQQSSTDKYHAVQVCRMVQDNWDGFRTIEFRQHRGTVDPQEIGEWITSIHELIDYAISTENE